MKGKRIVFLMLFFCWFFVPLSMVQAETLTVAGTGSSSPLIRHLFADFQKQHSNVSLRLIDPPLGSTGALKALEKGRIDLAVAGRPFALEERKKFGQWFNLADTPFVFASMDEQKEDGFSLEELAKVYADPTPKWPSGANMRVLVRNIRESDTLLMNEMSEDLKKAVAIANSRPGMTAVVNDLGAVDILARIQGSFGPTTLGLLRTLGEDIVVFSLNGVAPTLDNLQSGSYPWHKRLMIVLPIEPSPLAIAFANYLHSPEAHALMRGYDYLPITP